jgi:fatty acid desaturase
MHIICSFTFLKLTFLGHRTGREWTEGNQEIRDFAHHQIEASTDTQSNDACGLLSYIAYLGFNIHAVHHIFPTADNHLLPRLDKILTEEAKKMGIRRIILPSTVAGIYEVEANFYRRKLWRAKE